MNDDEKVESITVTVTFLEMKAPPATYSHPPLNRHVAILRTRSMPLHFLPASSPLLRLLNEALRFESWQEELEVPLSTTMP